jgi:hypothetical protein
VNRIDLVQCRNRLQSLVKTGMNLLVTWNVEMFLTSFTPRPLYHRGKGSQYPLGTPETVWTLWREMNLLPLSVMVASDVQPYVSLCTDYANRATNLAEPIPI